MKNVTISMEETVAQWARVEAAKAGKSLSRWLGQKLEAEMAEASTSMSMTAERKETLRSFLHGPGYAGVAADLPKREDLYDRPALLRHERPDLQPGPFGFHEESDSGGPDRPEPRDRSTGGERSESE